MTASRIRAVTEGLGQSLRQVSQPSDLLGVRLLLVDLNRDVEHQLESLAQLLGEGSSARVIAFGPHLVLASLRQRARLAGADKVIANSGLMALLGRMLRPVGDGSIKPEDLRHDCP